MQEWIARRRGYGELTAPERNRFYYSKLMDVFHFQMEQDYGRQKDALVNRMTFGAGVICGLGVRAEGAQLCVSPGFAIDGFGREIVVPIVACVDPWDPGCACCDTRQVPSRDNAATMTMWLCYRECETDFGPVRVSDCASREHCEAGTTVETWCLKLTPGRPPPPGLNNHICDALMGNPSATVDQRAWMRERLCNLLSGDCTAPADPCIPLAVVQLLPGGLIGAIEICSVRPRVYSNAVLLELILCLAQRIEECCGTHPTPTPSPMPSPSPTPSPTPPPPGPTPPPNLDTKFKVSGVAVAAGNGAILGSLPAAGAMRIQVAQQREPQQIEVSFTEGVSPSTLTPRNPSDPPATHSVLVMAATGAVLPGSVTLMTPTAARFRVSSGWPKGEFRVTLFGDVDPANLRPAISTSGNPPQRLDGEPTQLPSGDGKQGGSFVFTIDVV